MMKFKSFGPLRYIEWQKKCKILLENTASLMYVPSCVAITIRR